MKRTVVLRAGSAVGALMVAAVTMAAPAWSQVAGEQAARAEDTVTVDDSQSASPQEGIVVTGTRLATGFSAPTPVSVVGSDRLLARGNTSLGEALNELPSFRATQTPASSGLAATAGYIGGRILDLRGLGSVRTLTLVDGKRFVSSTTQSTVDTNMIPSVLLQRAEVVTGGASAQYGSDAVAGVVNLILNDKLEGLRLSAQQGVSRYGDNYTTLLSAGGGWKIGDRVHLVAGVEYERATGVGGCVERDWCRAETLLYGRNPGVTSIPGTSFLPRITPWSTAYNGTTTPPASAFVGQLVPTLRPIDGITFSQDGTPRRLRFGSLVNSLFHVNGENLDGEGVTSFFGDLFIVSPTERYAGMVNFNFALTPDITVALNGDYGHLKGRHRGVPYRNTALTIERDNPFLPRSSDPTLDIPTILDNSGLSSFTLGKGFEDVGPSELEVNNDVYRLVASVQGKISDKWSFDAYYQYGHNRFLSRATNATVTSRVLKAIDAVRNGSGQIVCRVNADASTANDDPACVALNPFGFANQSNFAAAKGYVTANGFQKNNTDQHVLAGNIKGTLFELPAGPVAIATGAEFRSEKVKGTADPLSATNQFFNGNGSLISGKVDVLEGYVEGEVPLFRDTPFLNEVSLNGAIRRTHYKRESEGRPSSSLSVTTWKIGAVWEPVEFLRFRTTRSRDIRAPNVSELFGPTTRGQGILTDVQRGGVPTIAPLTLGANPNLSPEKANTFTVGMVLQPKGGFLGRFRVSVDYFDIKIDDAIGTLGQQNIVTRCSQGDALSCSLITRAAPGAGETFGIVTDITDVFQNINKLINRGIDFEVSYKQPLGSLGNLDTRLLASYVKDLITLDSVGATDRAGQTGLRAGTPPGIPDWTLDGLFTWNYSERFSFTTHVRYINSGIYNTAFVGAEQEGYNIALPNSANTNRVPSRTYVDLLASFRIPTGDTSNFTFYAGVDNVFNTRPPPFPGANGTGNNILFNPVGQSWKAGIRASF